MIIYALFFLGSLLCYAYASAPADCCYRGYARGLSFVSGENAKVNCDPDTKMSESSNIYARSLCNRLFKSCCLRTTANEFCLAGVHMALENKECNPAYDLGGEHRQICCNCCKAGKQHALIGGTCADVPANGGEETCRVAFQDCCFKERKTCETVKCVGAHEVCVQSESGATCQCEEGYHKNVADYCVDFDECLSGNVRCRENSFCINTEGGFRCNCSAGYQERNNLCVIVKTSCKEGYEIEDGVCRDVDECKTGTHKCKPTSYCMNSEGAYRCLSECRSPGYQTIRKPSVGSGICADFDECTENSTRCLRNYECVNTIGSYDCKRVSCDQGYKLIRGYCEDIDECANASSCGGKGVCHNAYGSFYCDCHKGYTIGQDGLCRDYNECENRAHGCQYKCNNTEGGYSCYCPHGYELKKRYCYDINECETLSNPCGPTEKCFNTYGSYKCINEPCPSDYYIRISFNQCRKKYCTGNDIKCNLITESSLKWQAFKMIQDSPPKWFQFIYSLTGFGPDINFHYALVSGNEDHTFDIEKKKRGKVSIFNAKTLKASKEYRLVMYADILKGRRLLGRYVYVFYVFVSSHNF